MKKNIFVRILAAMGGIVLWLLALSALAETFFRLPVTAKIGQLLGAGTPVAVLLTLVIAIVLGIFGTCCLMMLSSKRSAGRKGFVMQKGENGAIGVSIKSIEGLVQTCVNQHEVVESAQISVVERRDGIVILLNIEEAAGVNIPLAVGALQKQIKQYVGTCTGVDVQEVRVMVESTERSLTESPFTVEKPVVMTTAATVAEMRREETAEPEIAAPVLEVAEPAEEEADPVEAAPVLELPVTEDAAEAEASPLQEDVPVVSIPVVPVTPIIPVMPEIIEEEDERPLHQRLFGMEDEPVFVPAPPELVIDPQTEEIIDETPETVVEEMLVEETSAEEAPAPEIEANAVLEVVEAIAEEEVLTENEYAGEETAEYDEEVLAEEAILDGAETEEEIPE
nr:alkaline shock response membrane anchor protein AmaP [Clostridia bacterium]